MRKVQIYFTDFFNVSEEILDQYGAFNISLRSDLPLFIDPFLLFYSSKKEYKELHDEIIKYLVFLKEKSTLDLSKAELKAWYMFPEQKQNWLGYSIGGNSGSGLGNDFAKKLKFVFKENFNDFGNEKLSKGTHLEKLCLINEGVGKDYISDFTVNLIKKFLLEYTEKFAKLYLNEDQCDNFWIQKNNFNYELEIWERKQYYLPKYNNDYIILTPRDILTRETAWINKDDMYRKFENIPYAIENDVLRMQINQYFNSQLATYKDKKPTKEEKNKAIMNTIRAYPEVLDYYIKQKEDDGNNAIAVSEKKVNDTEEILINNTQKLIGYLQKTKFFIVEEGNAYQETRKRVEYLKDAIENKDCYLLFYNDNEPIKREKDLQLMFRLVCYGSKFDINREVNNGRGPVDYKISNGAIDTSLIEFKLAKSTKLKQNLKNQLEIYKKSNDTTNGVKVILFFTEEEEMRARKIIKELGMEYDNNIILIDARKDNKPSASNVK